MSRQWKVVITDYDYGDLDIERAILDAVGADVVGLQAKAEAELFEAVADCDAVMNQYARVGAATIERMRRCKVIARYGVGVDIVDIEAATRRGILVTNVRDYCTEEVADHAIAMWLGLVR
jgi:D-3-phosphoglycerate dehydrogenase